MKRVYSTKDARRHPLYSVWKGIIERCCYPKSKKYHNYGGRGITVCNRWKQSFYDFVTDMGERPHPKMQVDRKENNGNYEPDNCHWVTNLINNHNRRDNIYISHNGENLCIAEWSRRLNIFESTIRYRHKQGWSEEKVLSPPHHR